MFGRLLATGCYWRWLLATGYVHLLRALAHVLDTHWCHPRKNTIFRAASCCTAAVALTATASACVCCCLLMPAAACCCLRLPAAGAAAGGCCCCRAAAIKQLPKQETTAAAAALLRALAHVLDTHWCHINEKTAKRDVWNPIEMYTRYI